MQKKNGGTKGASKTRAASKNLSKTVKSKVSPKKVINEDALLSKYEGRVKREFTKKPHNKSFNKPTNDINILSIKTRYADINDSPKINIDLENEVKFQSDTKMTPAIEVDLDSSVSYKVLEKHDSPEVPRKSPKSNSKQSNKELENYVISDKIQQNIQENERRHLVVVNQYESILKNLNSEFKKLMLRNKELESSLAENDTNYVQNSTDDSKHQVYLQKQLEVYNSDKLKWQSEREELIAKLANQSHIIDELKLKIDQPSSQQHAIVNDDYIRSLREENTNLKARYQEMAANLSETERVVRQKEESIFGLAREMEQMRTAVIQFENNEKLLKNELLSLIEKHEVSEKERNTLQYKLNECGSTLKLTIDKFDAQNREVELLKSNVEILKKHEARCMADLSVYKSEVSNLEDQLSILNLENKTLRLKLSDSRHAYDRLEGICNNLLNDYSHDDEARLIVEKEIELKRLKEIDYKRRESKERLQHERIRTSGELRSRDNFTFRNQNAFSRANEIRDYPSDEILDSRNVDQGRANEINDKPSLMAMMKNVKKLQEDPFWKNREMNEKFKKDSTFQTESEVNYESTPPKRKSEQKKFKIEDMPPAGMKSLERNKPDFHIKFVSPRPNALAAGIPSNYR